MDTEQTTKIDLISKLSDIADKFENGELHFVFFEMVENQGVSTSKWRFHLQYKQVCCTDATLEETNRAISTIRSLINTLQRGVKYFKYREEYDPVKGVDYSSLDESDEYGGYRGIIVDWES